MPFLVAAIAAPTEVLPSPCRVCPVCGRRWVQMAGSAFSEPRTRRGTTPERGPGSVRYSTSASTGLGISSEAAKAATVMSSPTTTTVT